MENTKEKASSEVRPEEKAAKPKAKENAVRDDKTRGRREHGKEGWEQWPKRTWKGMPKPRPKRT